MNDDSDTSQTDQEIPAWNTEREKVDLKKADQSKNQIYRQIESTNDETNEMNP